MQKSSFQEIEGLKPSLFQLFYLKNDRDEDVSIEEVDEIDFKDVERHLVKGESVFISVKKF